MNLPKSEFTLKIKRKLRSCFKECVSMCGKEIISIKSKLNQKDLVISDLSDKIYELESEKVTLKRLLSKSNEDREKI